MHSVVLQNLIEYQLLTAEYTNISVVKEHNLISIINNTDAWPRSTIGTCEVQSLAEVCEKIDRLEMSPFWVMDNNVSSEQIAFLEQNGFREVNRWEGMILKKEDYKFGSQKASALKLSYADQTNFLEWYKTAKEVMLPSKSIDAAVIRFWQVNDSFCLLLGMIGNCVATVGMSYRNGETAGLYFIATLPEFRGNGYARLLVQELIEKNFADGAKQIVLHASDMGYRLYENLGFFKDGPISTYWKIGRF